MPGDVDFERMRTILAEPFGYPGLPLRAERPCTRIWTMPSFAPWASWSLFYDRHHLVRRITWSPTDRQPGRPRTYAAEARVPTNVAHSLLDELATLDLEPERAEPPRVHLDGVTFGLRAETAIGAREVTFRDPPPVALEPVAAWLARAVHALDRCLPAASLLLPPSPHHRRG